MSADPRQQPRKPVLLNPPADDAMEEDDDEDELFGVDPDVGASSSSMLMGGTGSSNDAATIAASSATGMSRFVTSHTLISNFITPSPFPHHTSGPTSSRFRNAFTRILSHPTSDVEAWQALMTEVVNCYRQIQPKVHRMDAEIQLQLDWIESCYGTLLQYFPYSVPHIVGVTELLMAQSAQVGEEHGPQSNVGLDLQRQATAQAKLEYIFRRHLGITMDGTSIVGTHTKIQNQNDSKNIKGDSNDAVDDDDQKQTQKETPGGGNEEGMATHSVDLWMLYISARIRQARRTHPGDESLIRDWATKAYELALEHAGFGFQNHVLWKAYLQYVKVATSGDPQHMVILRSLYQRLVCHPMTGLDQLWQEYEQFERQQSEALAQALISEFSPKYQHARTIYLERNRVFHVQDLNMDRFATPPSDDVDDGENNNSNNIHAGISAEDDQCFQLWKIRTAYERTNPERLSTTDFALRIRTCYKEMVCSWTYYPEVWHMWSMWEESSSHSKESIARAVRVLEWGQRHIPDCTLLAHAQATIVEAHPSYLEGDNSDDDGNPDSDTNGGDPSRCLKVMERFLERSPNTLGFALYQQMARRYKGKDAARAVFSKARRVLVSEEENHGEALAATKTEEAVEGEETTDIQKDDVISEKKWMVTNRLDESIGKTTKPVPAPTAAASNNNESDITGKKSKVVKPGPITWHLYAFHAMIEHRLNRAPAIAARIYELGLRKHGSFLTQPAYVLRYAHLLLELQDTVNLRALLTRALAACSDRKTPQVAALWDMALQFETLVSIADATNVPAVLALERKRRLALLGPEVEDVATGMRVGMGEQPTIGAQKSTVAEHLVRQDGYELNSSIVNGMSRTVDMLDVIGLWGSSSGKSNPLGNTFALSQSSEEEEEVIPGGKSDMLYQKRQRYAKMMATGSVVGGNNVAGAGAGDAGSRLLSARERLQGAPASQNTAMTMAVQNSPDWLQDLLLLLPATKLRTTIIAKPPPHLTEMALASLRQNKLPDERPQDDKDKTGAGSKRKINSTGDGGDSSDEEGDNRGTGGYGTQFRASQRARLEGHAGV